MPSNDFNVVLYIVFITVIITLLIALAMTLIYSNNKKKALFQRQVETIQLNNEKQLLEAKVEIQENAFRAISGEIHDHITLSLTLAKLYLNSLAWDDPEKMKGQVQASIDTLGESIDDLRDMSRTLHSEIISGKGLLTALEMELGRIQRTRVLDISFSVVGESAYMDSDKELIIFRIIQEGFNNIIRHSGAKHGALVLEFSSSHLTIRIADGGRGFDTSGLSASTGLTNMKTRAEMLGGALRIESAPGRGTTIEVLNIPIQS